MILVEIPRSFMIFRNEETTVEIGCNCTVAFALLSAFTIALSALLSTLLPISLSLSAEIQRPDGNPYNPKTSLPLSLSLSDNSFWARKFTIC